MWAYLKQVLIAIDQLINALMRGWADETLSSRAWRHYEDGSYRWPKIVIDAILFFDPDHCHKSYQSEIERAQIKPSMRGRT